MTRLSRYLDPWSIAVLAITLLLFIVALFVKGFTHDLLLEAGVFLVSLKLIMMMYTNSVNTEEIEERLRRIEAAVDGIARQTAARS